MKKITNPRVLTVLATLFVFFLVLPMRDLVIYRGSELKGFLLVSLIMGLLYWAFSYSIHQFFLKDKWRTTSVLLISAILSILMGFAVSNIVEGFFSYEKSGLDEYLAIGDYLRDVHGINIYFFDMGGYLLTQLILIGAALFAVFSRVFGWLFTEIFDNKKNK